MKRILFSAALAALVMACEGSTDPLPGVGGPPGGGAITQAQASGEWSFTLTRTTTLACTGGSLQSDQVIFADLDVLSTGVLTIETSIWQVSGSAAIRPLAGSVNFNNGLASLTLFPSAANISSTSPGMELEGTLTSTRTFTGTMRDPEPNRTPVFSASGCAYTVTGSKTS